MSSPIRFVVPADVWAHATTATTCVTCGGRELRELEDARDRDAQPDGEVHLRPQAGDAQPDRLRGPVHLAGGSLRLRGLHGAERGRTDRHGSDRREVAAGVCPDCPSPSTVFLPWHEPLDVGTTVEIAVECERCDEGYLDRLDYRPFDTRPMEKCPACDDDGHRVVGTAKVAGSWPVHTQRDCSYDHKPSIEMRDDGTIWLYDEAWHASRTPSEAREITSQCHGLTVGQYAIELTEARER